MRSTSLGRSLALLILIMVQPPLIAQERRVALVIGNGNYRSVPKLANPANDAQDMALKLETLGFRVTKLLDGGLGDLLKAQSDFAEAAKGAGLRLFYYAGHGIQAGGENWLLPVDAEVKEDYELRAKALSAQLVLDGLKAAGPGVNIVLLDACRDNPFKAASRGLGESRGLAVMGTSGSLIAYATAPGSTAADGKGRNGLFTEALLGRLDSPGLSLQEIMTNVAADVVARTGGAQEPWKQDNLTRMVYFVTPEEARARFAERLSKGESELAALDSRLAGLKAKLGAERDAAKRRALELEIAKQAALQAQKRQEADALAAERERQARAEKERAALAAELAAYKERAAGREESLRQAAEARRRELEALESGGGDGSLPFVLAIESARRARSELGAQYDASLATMLAELGRSYDGKLGALAGWAEEPWENGREFKARVQAERSRLESEKGAALQEARSLSAAKRAAALEPFESAEAGAAASLEAARSTHAGASVRVEVGAFDKDEKCFPVSLVSALPELAYRAGFRCSIKSETAEELKRRYLEFDAWRKAGALFGELEASVRSLGEGGFVNIVERVRLKALSEGGEVILYEESPARPVSAFSGSADRSSPRPVGAALAVSAPGASILVDDRALGKDRAFLLDPKPGEHRIRALLADGSVLEERRRIASGAFEQVLMATTGSLALACLSPGELWLDGVLLGPMAPGSPLLLEKLLPGKRSLELRHQALPGERLSVTIKAGERAMARFDADSSLALVAGGSFLMGSPPGEKGRSQYEKQHRVSLSPFLIGRREVTRAEWEELMGSAKDSGGDPSLPASSLSWYACLAYCNRRSLRDGLEPCYSIAGSSDPGSWGPVPAAADMVWDAAVCDFSASGYRLPTEAEWEYAARGGPKAGSPGPGAIYAGFADPGRAGWYAKNSARSLHPVGQKEANALGLYDMAGNVEEWCWDWLELEYQGLPGADPRGPRSGAYRLLRGGHSFADAEDLRSASRSWYQPYRHAFSGLRLARRAPGPASAEAGAAAPLALEEPGKPALSDFASFLGLGPDDTIDAAIERLGAPTRTDKDDKSYSFDSCYWDIDGERALSISFDRASRKIDVVRATVSDASKADALRRHLRGKGIGDANLGLLGQPSAAILGLFGKPDDLTAGDYEYYVALGGGKAIVSFYCYDFRGKLCSEISVHWL